MSRAAFITRSFRCLRCSLDSPMSHFRAQFWTAPTFRGQPLTPSFRDLRCPDCGANAAWFEPWPRVCSTFVTPLRDSLRPVVFRWHDALGGEHYRYPASTDPSATGDALPRANEERIDFPTLRSLETFLKEQNPRHAEWSVPLNDVLDYDESHLDAVAADTSDPEGEALARELEADAGTITREEVEEFMARDDGRQLIESA